MHTITKEEKKTTTNCCMYNMYLNQQSIITTFTFNFHADGWDVSELTQLKESEGSRVRGHCTVTDAFWNVLETL